MGEMMRWVRWERWDEMVRWVRWERWDGEMEMDEMGCEMVRW